MSVMREKLKILIEYLNEEQISALYTILNSIVWVEDDLTPDEMKEVLKARNDIKNGKGIKAEDVWRELGI